MKYLKFSIAALAIIISTTYLYSCSYSSSNGTVTIYFLGDKIFSYTMWDSSMTGTGQFYFDSNGQLIRRTWSGCNTDLTIAHSDLTESGDSVTGSYYAGCGSADYRYYVDWLFNADRTSFEGQTWVDYHNDGNITYYGISGTRQ